MPNYNASMLVEGLRALADHFESAPYEGMEHIGSVTMTLGPYEFSTFDGEDQAAKFARMVRILKHDAGFGEITKEHTDNYLYVERRFGPIHPEADSHNDRPVTLCLSFSKSATCELVEDGTQVIEQPGVGWWHRLVWAMAAPPVVDVEVPKFRRECAPLLEVN